MSHGSQDPKRFGPNPVQTGLATSANTDPDLRFGSAISLNSDPNLGPVQRGLYYNRAGEVTNVTWITYIM